MKTEKASPCEKYELAITNYVLGEAIQMPKEELFNHLRKCPDCRADLKDWQATYSVMRAEAYDSRPEVKARSKAFIKKLASGAIATEGSPCQSGAESRPKRGQPLPNKPATVPVIEPIPGEKVLNHDEDIGDAAVKLWHYLAQNGKIKVNDLKRKIKLPTDIFHQAVGWLARENQIYRTRVKKSTFVYLAPEEIQRHQAQAQG